MTKGLYVSADKHAYTRLREQLQTHSLCLIEERGKQHEQDVRFIVIDSSGGRTASLVARYRDIYPEAFILVLNAKRDEDDLLEAYAKGVDDYQFKPCSEREVAIRIRAMLRRSRENPPKKSEELLVDPDSCHLEWKGSRLPLTRVECKLLHYLYAHDKIISRQQLAEAVWEGNLSPSSKVIDVHIFNLRKKLQQATCGQVTIRTVTNKGFHLSREGMVSNK
jgi:DNA-binding response OmpR family regulator